VSPIELPRVQLLADTPDDTMWQEFALDDDAIIEDLATFNNLPKLGSPDLVLSPLTPLSTPPSSVVLSVVPALPPVLHSNSMGMQNLETRVINNKHAIAMQNILSAEDDLVKTLHVALSLSHNQDNQAILARHISPSIQEQLSSNYDPPPLTLPTADTKGKSPPSPSAPSPTKCPQCELAKFKLQKKEKRHQSYGVL